MRGISGFTAVKGRARARHIPGTMNKLEQEYDRHLNQRQIAGEITSYQFESIKLKLADKTYYTADFLVVKPDGLMELHEVKGFWEDDARVKIKVAAAKFWMFQFIGVQKDKTVWRYEEFKG